MQHKRFKIFSAIRAAVAGFLPVLFVLNANVFGQPVTFTIQLNKQAQVIENFGASGAWFSEGIGKFWPLEKKERMAELLFSKAFDKAGNPLGIGLSAWRFNIGGGTAEQGDSSGISDPLRRVECFLAPGGTYNWNKQEGYQWFLKKAALYGVKDLVAFSNTPPVQFTKNGLGFKTEKDYGANLKEDRYDEYADFLVKVVEHFNKEGIPVNFISPVNEPQWDWSAKFGHMNQEGSPWFNKDIYRIAVSLDSALSAKKLNTQILLTESGDLTSLYRGKNHASSQVQHFYSTASPLFIGRLSHLHPVIAGHSYFTDGGDSNMIAIRKNLHDTVGKYRISFWQSEYCMLGDGYKDGAKGKISAMDCALFLAKIIHHDLTVANATAWQYWNAWEPGNADEDTRYYLLALQSNATNTAGDFTITKNLWALGHFSRFVRPGMHRLLTGRSDGLNEVQAAKDIMLSAFADEQQVVVVLINYSAAQKEIKLELPGIKKIASLTQFVTSAAAADNMARYPLKSISNIQLAPRSVATIVIDLHPRK